MRRIDIQPNKRGYGKNTMLYNGKAIGKSEQALFDAARWLLENNAASETDTVATYRGETLSMHGVVGDLAKWAVVETKHGNPSLYLRRYRPFSNATVAAQDSQVTLPGAMGATPVPVALPREDIADEGQRLAYSERLAQHRFQRATRSSPPSEAA